MASDGGFVVAWSGGGDQDGSGSGIFGRRFDSAGTALGGEFSINAVTADPQTAPAIAMTGAGDFVVAWASNGQDTSGYGVFARRFNSAGTSLAGEFQVTLATIPNQRYPAVSMASAGSFIVAWERGQDGSGYAVLARRFKSSGPRWVGSSWRTHCARPRRVHAVRRAVDRDVPRGSGMATATGRWPRRAGRARR